jgi:hypothetical protein
MEIKEARPSPRGVARIFSDRRVGELVAEVGLEIDPPPLPELAEAIRTFARRYLRDKGTASDGDVGREITSLYWAADRHQHAKAAGLVRGISERTRTFLDKRAEMVALRIPKPSAFLNPVRRDAACETLRQLCSRGGHWDDNGEWVPLLHVPKRKLTRELMQEIVEDDDMAVWLNIEPAEIELRPQKCQAERDFIMWVQAFYLNAGRMPPVTASRYEQTTNDRKLVPGGPFVRLMQRCLDILGAEKIDATGAINELRKQAKTLASQGKGKSAND